MPKASEVASALRALAASLECKPDAHIPSPLIAFYAREKDLFKNVVSVMPRPLRKKVFLADSTYPDLHVEHDAGAATILASIPQSLTCTLIEPARPAKYNCEPILSPEEDADLLEVQ